MVALPPPRHSRVRRPATPKVCGTHLQQAGTRKAEGKPRRAGNTKNRFRVRGQEPPWKLPGPRGRLSRCLVSEASEAPSGRRCPPWIRGRLPASSGLSRHVGAGRVRATLRFHQLGLRKRVRGWRGLGPGAQRWSGAASRRRGGGAGGAALHPHPRPGPRCLWGGHAVPPHRGSAPRLRPLPGLPAPSFPAPLSSAARPWPSMVRRPPGFKVSGTPPCFRFPCSRKLV